MAKKLQNQGLVVYQAKSGAIELRGDYKAETIWATQAQIATAFNVDVRTINEHISNIYTTKELAKTATIRKFRIVQKEGKREIRRDVNHYNLDVILSAGYRVNSKKATLFRQWATKTLRSHIVEGYTINKTRISKNYSAFMQAVSDVRALLPTSSAIDNDSIFELISLFAATWFSLGSYDKEKFVIGKSTKKKVVLTAQQLSESIGLLKEKLIQKKETTNLFASERNKDALEGIVGNVMQSFGGKDVYDSVEMKAAHLLYFIVKNHPFVDGNKRAGAYAFVWFLRTAGILDVSRLNPAALTAMTLLIAESSSKDKDKITGLVAMLLVGS